MKSKIFESDMTGNANRQFGAGLSYLRAWYIRRDGTRSRVLLTVDAMEVGMHRAEANPEDFPPTVWQRIMGWFR
jgi:hypothetical protein